MVTWQRGYAANIVFSTIHAGRELNLEATAKRRC
jgi:hypothetical protein